MCIRWLTTCVSNSFLQLFYQPITVLGPSLAIDQGTITNASKFYVYHLMNFGINRFLKLFFLNFSRWV